MKNENNIKLNIFEMLNQSIDAYVHNEMMDQIEDEYTLAVLQLFNEYGLYGMRLYEFTNKINMLNKMFNKEEESGS